MQESSSSWITGRHGWVLPWLALGLVLLGTLLIDRHWTRELESERTTTEANAQQGATVIANALTATLGERIAALDVPALQGAPTLAALDSAVLGRPGLAAVSWVGAGWSHQTRIGRVPRAPRAQPRIGLDRIDPIQRTLASGSAAASTVVDLNGVQRLLYLRPANGVAGAVVAAELDPRALLRSAIATLPPSSLTGLYGLNGPAGVPITLFPLPVGWSFLSRPVRVGDADWEVRVGYPIPESSVYSRIREATWIAGLAVALTLASVLLFTRRIVGSQDDEINRREEVESKATLAARNAEESARQAEELTGQLEAAHDAAQRLSTSLDPDYVLEFFLGVVGEALDADTASLFTFDEDGELLVGRKRVMLRTGSPEAEGLREEDIRQVRVPVAFLPQLAEAASTGDPVIVPDAASVQHLRGLPGGVETAAAWVTIPLKVGGHMIGVAIWEVFRGPQQFDPKDVAFAQALAAQAAAALRTAELYASLESVSARATWEANRFGGVLDQMADGVVIADGSGKLERYNAAAERMLGPRPTGISVEDWAARLDLSIDHRTLEAQETPILRALRGETLTRMGFVARGPGGVERHLSASAAPIVADGGGHAGAAMVVRDVTDEQQYAGMLRHTNQELRKQAALLEEINQQLREATAAKDRFLAVMSHELRTPLNAVIGYADLLDLQIKGPLNPDQNQMVRRVIETARHLLALIDEVLDLAKVGAGQVDLRIEPIRLRDVVEQAVDQIAPLAHAKGLRLELDTSDDKSQAMADRTRLTQVILNLLSNAVKFTEHGEISIATRSNGGSQVELRVRDTGRGIDRDHHERIFEEFYQVEDGLTRSAGGTGLGLAIARRYTRLMGGDLMVESEIGKGSDFIVLLPANGSHSGPQ